MTLRYYTYLHFCALNFWELPNSMLLRESFRNKQYKSLLLRRWKSHNNFTPSHNFFLPDQWPILFKKEDIQNPLKVFDKSSIVVCELWAKGTMLCALWYLGLAWKHKQCYLTLFHFVPFQFSLQKTKSLEFMWHIFGQ